MQLWNFGHTCDDLEYLDDDNGDDDDGDNDCDDNGDIFYVNNGDDDEYDNDDNGDYNRDDYDYKISDQPDFNLLFTFMEGNRWPDAPLDGLQSIKYFMYTIIQCNGTYRTIYKKIYLPKRNTCTLMLGNIKWLSSN